MSAPHPDRFDTMSTVEVRNQAIRELRSRTARREGARAQRQEWMRHKQYEKRKAERGRPPRWMLNLEEKIQIVKVFIRMRKAGEFGPDGGIWWSEGKSIWVRLIWNGDLVPIPWPEASEMARAWIELEEYRRQPRKPMTHELSHSTKSAKSA